jgi:hypothetical protein
MTNRSAVQYGQGFPLSDARRIDSRCGVIAEREENDTSKEAMTNTIMKRYVKFNSEYRIVILAS